MKALKLTLIVAVLLTAFTSCTKEDLNEDDVLINKEAETTFFTGGHVQD